MHCKTLLAAAASAALVAAQNNSFVSVLNNTPELSTLNELLQNNTEFLNEISNATNITVLAPSNQVLDLFLGTVFWDYVRDTPGALEAALRYHVLNGTHYASEITPTPQFLNSYLAPGEWANVTGGQVVEGVRLGTNVTFRSAYKLPANVTTADLNFTNGVVHVIDSFLLFPENVTATAQTAGLTSLYGALNATNLSTPIDTASDITVFAPVNAAFQSIAGTLSNLSTAEAASILEYHVLNGTVAYSSLLSDTSNITTLSGEGLNITVVDGAVFVNSARVIIADILTANGVVHVIDSVLNPNATVSADPSATTPIIAFPSASSASEAPYTSGATGSLTRSIATTDNVVSGYTTPPSGALTSQTATPTESTATTESSEAGAMPTAVGAMGAMGAAALFGGAVLLV